MSKAAAWASQQLLSAPTVNTITITGKEVLAAAEGAKGSCTTAVSAFSLADTVATNTFTVSFPNVTGSALLQVSFTCLHGDGTASHSGIFVITIDRVAGATAVVGASTIAGAVQATTTGAGSVTIAVTAGSAITGGVTATQSIRVRFTATKTNGTSTTHPFAAEGKLLLSTATGATITATVI